MEEIIKQIWENKITTLDLSFRDISENNLKKLCKALANNLSVTKLDLSNCKLGAYSLEYLAIMLKENTSITDLNLSDNNFTTDNHLYSFVEAFQKHKILKKLSFANNPKIIANSSLLYNFLLYNNDLEFLDISKNKLAMQNMQNMLNALQNHAALKTLNLSDNLYTNKFLKLLSESLPKNCKTLFLADNKIDLAAYKKHLNRNFNIYDLGAKPKNIVRKGLFKKLSKGRVFITKNSSFSSNYQKSFCQASKTGQFTALALIILGIAALIATIGFIATVLAGIAIAIGRSILSSLAIDKYSTPMKISR